MRNIVQFIKKRNILCQFLALLMVLNFLGCASVPKEVVELSYTVGQDLNAVHLSYRQLIQTHFDGLRKQATGFLDNKWTPIYIKNFIKKGKLVERANNSDPNMVLLGVRLWAEVAVKEIEKKKKELIDPIDKNEKKLLNSIDEAFAQLISANAAITAHLNSIRKVKEVQDEALQALKVKDLRDKINNGLIFASDKANEAIEKVKKAEGIVDDLAKKKKELIN
jgi:hypothetical protein